MTRIRLQAVLCHAFKMEDRKGIFDRNTPCRLVSDFLGFSFLNLLQDEASSINESSLPVPPVPAARPLVPRLGLSKIADLEPASEPPPAPRCVRFLQSRYYTCKASFQASGSYLDPSRPGGVPALRIPSVNVPVLAGSSSGDADTSSGSEDYAKNRAAVGGGQLSRNMAGLRCRLWVLAWHVTGQRKDTIEVVPAGWMRPLTMTRNQATALRAPCGTEDPSRTMLRPGQAACCTPLSRPQPLPNRRSCPRSNSAAPDRQQQRRPV